MEAPLPDDETERLGVLYEHEILDTAPEEKFEDLVRLAAHVCGVPIAAISLIDEYRQWFKASVGLDVTETPRESAFCAHTILQPNTLIVPDAQADPRFADNPLVIGDPGIRFYAGAPLITEEGYALGSLCVIDRIPKQLTPDQEETLRLLARQVARHLKAVRRIAEREKLIQEKEHLLAEKERLAAIIDSSEDAIYGKTLDGTITSWNGGAARLYGYSAAEIIGRHVDILAPPERRGEIENILAALRRGETVASEETVRVTKVGRRVNVSLQVSSIRDAGGNVIGASVIARDITARIQSETERLRLAAIVETSSDAIYSKTLDGRITSWNHGAECLYGYTAAEIIGRHVNLLVPDERQGEVQDIMAAIRSGRSVVPLETVRRTKTGAPVTVSLRVSSISDSDGTVQGASMIAHDITARKQAERALQAEREFTNALLESLQEGIVACDAHGTLTLFNSATREFHGLPEQPLSPEQWTEHFDLYEADGVTPMRTQNIPLLRALQGEIVRDTEMVISPKFGMARTLLVNGQAIYGPNGERLGAVAAMHDITARRRAEEESMRLAAIVESSEEAILAATLDGTILSWNRGAERLYGYAAAEMVGRHISMLTPPGETSSVPAIVTRLLRGAAVAPLEVTRLRRDGTTFSAALSFSPIKDTSGRMVGLSCVARDITERRQAEDALAESEARLRRLTDAAFEGVVMMQDGIIVEASDAWATLFGFDTPTAAIGLPAANLVAPESLELVAQKIAEDNEEFYEATLLRCDGTTFQAEMRGRSIQIGGHPARITAVRDVTERKYMETALQESNRALQESQAFIQAIADSSAHMLYVFDLDTRSTVYANTGLGKFWGYAPDQIQAMGRELLPTVIHRDDLPFVKSHFRDFAGVADGEIVEFEARYLHADGEWRWMWVRETVFNRRKNGTPRQIMGTVQDITERKRAEALLVESRQRLTLATESAQIGIWDWDVVANKMLWDTQMYALYGIREQDFSGAYDAWQAGLHPEDRARAEAEILPALEGSRDFHTQFRVIRPNGEVRHIEAHAVVQRASNGSARRMIGVNWDITERKRTESALVESEARFRTSIDAMEEGMALQGVDGAILMCNESAERILGLTADQMAGRTSLDPRWRSVHEDGTDFPGNQHPAMVALQEGTPQRNVVMGIHKPSGELTWVNINAVPLLTEQTDDHTPAQSRGVVVTFSDITERRRQEEALRQSEAALRAVLESAPVILYAADAEGMVTLSEGTGLAALGLKPGEVVGRSVYEFSGGDAEIEAYTRRALAGEAASYDAHYAGLCLHTELRPVRDASETVTGIIGVCFDVTERVASEERFRVLFEQSSDAHLLFGEHGIIDCNPATVALLRCSDITEVLSLHPAVLSPEFQPDGRRSDEKCIEMDALARKHGFHRFEWTHRKMDGEHFPVEVTLTPVTLGNHPVLLTVWHDLTERKQAEQQTKDYAVLLEFQMNELEEANAQLENLATTDGLTGLHNHRAFQERLAEEVSRANRYGTPLSLVLLDVDSFKSFNDTHGHPAGDAVLKAVASVLQSCARDTDLVARYGGEEFVLILPQTDRDGAAAFAERLRAAVEGHPWPVRAVTASFGAACLHPADESGAELVVRADAALYRSKKEGRNRVTCDGVFLPADTQSTIEELKTPR